MQVILDTDPGGDDAIALMWLASLVRRGRVVLRAVTTTAGNVGRTRAWANATGILSLCGLEQVPVGLGSRAVREPPVLARHGEDGVGGLARLLPASRTPAAGVPCSRDLLGRALCRQDSGISLLAVGPLTNLAAVDIDVEGTLSGARDLIIVGGALGPGPEIRDSEFNFRFDPEAAARVLATRCAGRLVTLDSSRQLRLEQPLWEAIVSDFEGLGAARFFQRLCEFMADRDRVLYGRQRNPGFPVHDAAAVAWLAYPDLFQGRRRTLMVDTAPGPQRGWLREVPDPGAPAIEVASRVSPARLLRRLERDLRQLFAMLAGN